MFEDDPFLLKEALDTCTKAFGNLEREVSLKHRRSMKDVSAIVETITASLHKFIERLHGLATDITNASLSNEEDDPCTVDRGLSSLLYATAMLTLCWKKSNKRSKFSCCVRDRDIVEFLDKKTSFDEARRIRLQRRSGEHAPLDGRVDKRSP